MRRLYKLCISIDFRAMLLRNQEKIKIGDKVTVVIEGTVKDLEIVDFLEGDLKKGKVSFLSPIARAIIGHRYPEQVTIKLPNGKTLNCRLIKTML